MARTLKRASKGKRAKKGKIRDLQAGRKAKGVKGGAFISSLQPQGPDLKPTASDTLTGGKFTCIPM